MPRSPCTTGENLRERFHRRSRLLVVVIGVASSNVQGCCPVVGGRGLPRGCGTTEVAAGAASRGRERRAYGRWRLHTGLLAVR